MQFSDTSQESLVKGSSTGCYLSRTKICLLVLGVAVACTIVGVAVYFAHPDKKSNSDDEPTVIVPSKPTDAPAVDSPLLPDTMAPEHYDLRLRPDIYRDDPDNFMFSGDVSINVTVKEATREVVLHQRNLNIHDNSLIVATAGGQTLAVDYVKKQLEKEFYTIVLEEELKAGDKIRVSMSFEGPLRNDLTGIYWSSYKDDNNETKYLVTSQLQSTDARKTFPCFDEPKYKATFAVRLEHRASHNTIGNMEVEKSEDLGDGWYADQYGASPVMSSYLLAFMVSDFKCKNSTTSKSSKVVYVCARPNAIDQVDYALSLAGEMQEFFEDYHQIPYPLPKTVHVAVPDFSAGAMENWGLIIYRETALLYDESITSAAFRQRVAVVISHELAHQWFGNLVTCEWWDDIWLNEGFASYMENLGVDSQYMEGDDKYWEMEGQFVQGALQYVFLSDSLLSSHPVYQPVDHPSQISQLFDGITYDKGSSVIRMMNYFLGEEIFKKGLTAYLNENAYGVTTHTELFDFLTKEAKAEDLDIDVNEVMNTWIKQMGYPVVTLKQEGDKISMKQERFLFEQPTEGDLIKPSPYGYKWIIPVTYVTSENAATDPDTLDMTWLRDATGSVTDASSSDADWILGNVGQRFYYRVNYEGSNWQALYKQLIDDHSVFSVINRAQLIDDSFILGRAGVINITMGFEASAYMEKEEHYVPWRAFYANTGYIKTMLQYDPLSVEPLREFIRSVVQGIADKLGWQESGDVDKDHLQNRLRPLVHNIACSSKSQSCLANATQLYNTWMTAGTTPSPNFLATVACYGIHEGGDDEWQFGLSQYLLSNVASAKSDLLSALACATNQATLENYLDMLLVPEKDGGLFRDQDAGTIMASVSGNPDNGKVIAWKFYKDNYDNYIFPRFGYSTFRMASLISSLTSRFSTTAELTDLQNFIDNTPDQGTGVNAFQQALESTRSNIAWREAHEDDIVEWLNKKNNE